MVATSRAVLMFPHFFVCVCVWVEYPCIDLMRIVAKTCKQLLQDRECQRLGWGGEWIPVPQKWTEIEEPAWLRSQEKIEKKEWKEGDSAPRMRM